MSTPADTPRWLGIGNEAADRGGGGVPGGLRADGDQPHRLVRLATADSLCDRMERGEEEATTGRRDAHQRIHFGRCQARRLPTSDRRKSPSGDFRRARDLRSQRESAVDRRSATQNSPRLPADRPARLRRHGPQLRSRFRTIVVCPPAWKRSRDLGVLVLAKTWASPLFSKQRANADLLRLLARGTRAVRVGAPFEG